MKDDIKDILIEDPTIIKDYPILEIIYNTDGTKKSFYSLACEKDIKETQIKSDENELEYNYSQNKIDKEEYQQKKEYLNKKLNNQSYVYDTLIFDLIKNEEMDNLKKEIINAKLGNVELNRLATSLESIAEKKIADFQENNKEFKMNNISLWNYKYDIIAKNYAKTRELESFILALIE